MKLFNKKEKPPELTQASYGTKSEKGKDIFKKSPFANYLAALKSLVSCPSQLFEDLYGLPFYCLAEFCQAMPADREKIEEPYGLLSQQCALVLATLKLRRGLMLPAHASSEMMAKQEAQWTYAMFVAACVHRLSTVQQDRQVLLFNAQNESLGNWNPIAGTLYEPDTFYQVNFIPQEKILPDAIFIACLVSRFTHPLALRWLAETPPLYEAWWDCLHQTPQENNPIHSTLEKACEKLGFTKLASEESTPSANNTADTSTINPSPVESSEVEVEESNEAHPVETLVSWLTAFVNENTNAINKTLLHRLPEGLLVTTHLLESYLQQQSTPQSTESFVSLLKEHQAVVLYNQSPYHRYCPVDKDDRRIFEGLLLANSVLNNTLQQFPINPSIHQYIPL